ncbi:hypothetical protein [Thermodesulforhabdus norvegica]|uniref:Uncharacterized protein n=1 Tax=Thermodesulforhabdus norvegica TaxID=39841 RepID=A0A1I4V7I2_9BACT|nr:hypothetical protein [Thermodesulforhabdus norvegica]SFM96970.1 hypothetical protein SAMN05660836_02143 [Thermodesulforhabdus norvegica]
MAEAIRIKLKEIRRKGRDYFLASWQEGELVLEPHCFCGQELEEDYVCPVCERSCNITCFVCKDPQALAVVEKFIFGHPQFRDFEAYLLDTSE